MILLASMIEPESESVVNDSNPLALKSSADIGSPVRENASVCCNDWSSSG